jgi:peptidoglycan/LPS O-acetylase OafA/YrhL
MLELDALRGIAASSVVVYHFTTRYEQVFGFEDSPAFAFPAGHYGVQLFFVVSGFVIFLTLSNCGHALDFVVARFARLYPVYWAAVLTTFTVVTLFGLEGRERTPVEAMVNLTMLQGFVGVSSVDGVYWTLKWELVFYFWALLLFLLKWQRFALHACALLLLSQWGVVWLEYRFEAIPGMVKLLSLNTYGNLFGAGILFYLLMNGSTRHASVHVLLLIALGNQILVQNLEEFFVTCLIFALFYLFVYGKLGFIARKPLVLLGTISYALYLIHEFVGWIVIRELLARGANSTASVLIAAVVVLGLASVLTYGVEHPAIRRIKTVYQGRYRPRLVRHEQSALS